GGPQRVGKFVRVVEAIRWRLGERLRDGRLGFNREFGVVEAHGLAGLHHLLVDDGVRGTSLVRRSLAAEWLHTGHHLVEDAREGVDVAAAVDGLAAWLLGRNERRRPDGGHSARRRLPAR